MINAIVWKEYAEIVFEFSKSIALLSVVALLFTARIKFNTEIIDEHKKGKK